MALGKWEKDALQDQGGNAIVVSGATVEVRHESDGSLLSSSELFADFAGTIPLGNPFNVVGTQILFYAPLSDRYRVAITQGLFFRQFRYESVTISPIADYIASTLFGATTDAQARLALGMGAFGESLTLTLTQAAAQTLLDVDPAGTAAAEVASHEAATDPHPQYGGAVGNVAFISNAIANADATIDIDISAGDADDVWVIDLARVQTDTAGDRLLVRFSIDGGTTFRTGAAEYGYTVNQLTDLGVSANDADSTAAFMALTNLNGVEDNAGGVSAGISGRLIINRKNVGAGKKEHIYFIGVVQSDNEAGPGPLLVGGFFNVNGGITDVRFYFESSNIDAGEFIARRFESA